MFAAQVHAQVSEPIVPTTGSANNETIAMLLCQRRWKNGSSTAVDTAGLRQDAYR